MRTARYELNLYSLYDHTGMERHFEKMAAKGWMIEKLGDLWRYRRCEPKQLRFSVAYYPDGSEYDPLTPSEEEQTFWDYCASAGWTKVAYRAQMHVFCNEEESAVPIETESAVQVETLHRAMKREFLLGRWILLLLSLFQIVMQAAQMRDDLTDTLASMSRLSFFADYILLAFLCAFDLFDYHIWRRRAKQAAEELGRFTPTRSHPVMQGAILAAVLVMAAAVLLGTAEIWRVYLFAFAGISVLIAATYGFKELLRRKGVNAGTAKMATVGAVIVLTVIYMAVMMRGVLSGWLASVPKNAEAYEYSYQHGNGEVYTGYAHHDELLFYVEELTETEYDRYSCRRTTTSSPLLSKIHYEQEMRRGDWDIDAPEVYCTVYDVNFPPLFDLCLNDLLTEYADREFHAFLYRAVDAAPWGADTAYQLYDSEDDADFNTWVLTYGTRIALLSVNEFTLDAADMALIGARLGA